MIKIVKDWETCDGFDYCDNCGKYGALRKGIVKVMGKLADLYPDGKSGYFCQQCHKLTEERV